MTRDVEITLDKKRNLRYTINSLCAVEEKAGIGFESLILTGQLSALRLLLWAGLRHEDEDLSVEDAGDLIDAYLDNDNSIEELGEYIEEALTKAGFADQEGDENEGNFMEMGEN